MVNRNKEHMMLNLKSAEGREIFYRLAAAADIFVEGFRPEVVKRPLSIENCKPWEEPKKEWSIYGVNNKEFS